MPPADLVVQATFLHVFCSKLIAERRSLQKNCMKATGSGHILRDDDYPEEIAACRVAK